MHAPFIKINENYTLFSHKTCPQGDYTIQWTFSQLQQILTVEMIQHIKKLFLAMIGLTCFTCFQRADYNLPLFAFTFFLWDYKHPNLQRIRLFYLFVLTWIADFVWVVYWGVTWSSDDYQRSGASGTSSFVLTLSIIAFVLKLAIIIILYLFDPDCKTTIKNFIPNLKTIVSAQPDRQEGDE